MRSEVETSCTSLNVSVSTLYNLLIQRLSKMKDGIHGSFIGTLNKCIFVFVPDIVCKRYLRGQLTVTMIKYYIQ
jgi:hypothetical protein